MTETVQPVVRRGVPLWAQVLIWSGLVALLVIIGIMLNRRSQGNIQVGERIPDFTLPLFSGYEYNGQTEIRFADLRGQVVVINFWASWCKPCEQEAAELQAAWEYYRPGGQVIFLGVDYVDTEPEARLYLQKYGITYPNGPDRGTRLSQLFRISGVPETYFVDRNGVLRHVRVGPFASLEEIQRQVDLLLSE